MMLLKHPLRRLEDDAQMVGAEFLKISYRRADLLVDIVLVFAHPAAWA